jgi:MFS family permease
MPAFVALARIRAGEIDHDRARGAVGPTTPILAGGHVERELWWNSKLLTFAGCAVLFHLANASALILVGVNLVHRGRAESALVMAALMIFPQLVTVLIAPWISRQAELWGRKPLLLFGFGVLPVRVMLLSTTTDPGLLIAVQLLDGIGGVVMGVVTPLVIADAAAGTGRYNLAQGVYGAVIGVGASGSMLLAGLIAEFFSLRTGLVVLAAIALAGVAAIALFMPETKPGAESAHEPARATAAD